MKKFFTACLLLIASTAIAQSSGPGSLNAILTKVRSQMEVQIERVKRAREVADSRVELAGIRVEEQLLRAEEDLTIQNEKLGMLQEELVEQLKDADQAYLAFRNEWRPACTQAVRNIRAQIGITNALIGQLQRAQAAPPSESGGGFPAAPAGCPYANQPNPNVIPDLVPPSLAELEAELSRLEPQGSTQTALQPTAGMPPISPGPTCTRCRN